MFCPAFLGETYLFFFNGSPWSGGRPRSQPLSSDALRMPGFDLCYICDTEKYACQGYYPIPLVPKIVMAIAACYQSYRCAHMIVTSKSLLAHSRLVFTPYN